MRLARICPCTQGNSSNKIRHAPTNHQAYPFYSPSQPDSSLPTNQPTSATPGACPARAKPLPLLHLKHLANKHALRVFAPATQGNSSNKIRSHTQPTTKRLPLLSLSTRQFTPNHSSTKRTSCVCPCPAGQQLQQNQTPHPTNHPSPKRPLSTLSRNPTSPNQSANKRQPALAPVPQGNLHPPPPKSRPSPPLSKAALTKSHPHTTAPTKPHPAPLRRCGAHPPLHSSSSLKSTKKRAAETTPAALRKRNQPLRPNRPCAQIAPAQKKSRRNHAGSPAQR